MKALIFATLASTLLAVWACDLNQYHNGCKIYGNSCRCGYGCPTDYIYKTKRACNNALRGQDWYTPYVVPQPVHTPPPPPPPPSPVRGWNICYRAPCVRGICIQTANEPGFACKCEGTGFYGQRCEKACPTFPISGMAFPHECVII